MVILLMVAGVVLTAVTGAGSWLGAVPAGVVVVGAVSRGRTPLGGDAGRLPMIGREQRRQDDVLRASYQLLCVVVGLLAVVAAVQVGAVISFSFCC
jgi:hypothetical protein